MSRGKFIFQRIVYIHAHTECPQIQLRNLFSGTLRGGVVTSPSGSILYGYLIDHIQPPPFPGDLYFKSAPSPENPHIRTVSGTIPPPPYPWYSSGPYYSQEHRIRGFLGKTARSGSLERVTTVEGLGWFALHPPLNEIT